jgi:RimJ/RimL family protein N-acetyltransferase
MVTLETERLLLRMFRAEDFESYAEMCADPEVMQYLPGGKPLSRENAWRQMAATVGEWHLTGYGAWAVQERETGRLLGRLGFVNWAHVELRPSRPEALPGLEIGWVLSRASWGRGYATEGARRAIDYAFTDLGRDYVVSIIHPDNNTSVRVAERLGQKIEGRAQVSGTEALVYRIDREAWAVRP